MKKFERYMGKVVYFIGIGGVSMSALARLTYSLGFRVAGSDIVDSEYVALLKGMGIEVYSTHSSEHIDSSIGLVVYSGAVGADNVEILEARAIGIECIERGEYLGMISSMYRDTIAISGTHGKTTITAMISHICKMYSMHPTMHLGGISVDSKDNVMLGGKDLFITEACEYRDSFRSIHPHIAVVSNIEKEHMDYYPSLDAIIDSYNYFVGNADMLVMWVDTNTSRLKCKSTYTCGFSTECDFSVHNIKAKASVGYIFDVYKNGEYLFRFENNLIGMHNVVNSVLAIATAYIYGVRLPYIYMGILSFKGVYRRYEYVGDYMDTPVIIDYAHHPTEISSSIAGIKERYNRILCIFQPHTYSRTLSLMPHFRHCFRDTKSVVVYKTYPAREKSIVGGRAVDLYNMLLHPSKKYVSSKVALKEYLVCVDFGKVDVVLVLGAGNIDKIVRSIISR